MESRRRNVSATATPTGNGSGADPSDLMAMPSNRQFTHVYDDGPVLQGTSTPTNNISVDLLDSDGYWSDVGTQNIVVYDTPPTALFSGNGSVSEGSIGSVLFANQYDVSATDRAAGYTYEYDFNDSGIWSAPTTADFANVPASYLSVPGQVTVVGRIFDVNGGYTDYTHVITVDEVNPTVNAGPNANVGAGNLFTQTGTFVAPGNNMPWTVYVNYNYDPVLNPGPGPAIQSGSSKSFTLSNTYATPGTYTIQVTVVDAFGGTGTGDVVVTVVNTPFQVTSFASNPSGFNVSFNRAANLTKLHLYEGLDPVGLVDELGGSPDVTVVGASTGPVEGSLVWDASTDTATFVKTGGVLTPDTYTVTLVSGPNDWADVSGNALDGNIGGGNYVATFTVASSSAPVLTLPDFARGPGQPVNTNSAGLATATGLAVSINQGYGVENVDFDLYYNPTLLDITAVAKASGVPADWGLTYNFIPIDSTHAEVAVTTYSTTTSTLSSGSQGVVVFTANVPATAPYAASEALRLTSVVINGSSAVGGVAVHKVAYFGDANGNGLYQGSDAAFISRVVVGLDTGFGAYLLTDPMIIANVAGDATLNGEDATLVAEKGLGVPGITQIPNLPGLSSIVMGGVDPIVSIPAGIVARPGSVVQVPVDIQGPSDAGLMCFDLQFTYDTRLLNVSDSDVKLSGLTSKGWNLTVNVDASRGVIYVSAYGSAPLSECVGTILDIAFHVPASVLSGTSAITVGASPNGGLNDGALVLTTVNGSIVVGNPATAARPQPAAYTPTSTAYEAALRQMVQKDPANRAYWLNAVEGLYDYEWLSPGTLQSEDILDPVDAVFADYGQGDEN